MHEKGTIPRGERGLDWLLLTNAPIDTFEQVRDIIKAHNGRMDIQSVPGSGTSVILYLRMADAGVG